ncbi:MAG: hypothetical protein DME77_06805 [Verrucomicrobia bacterium]|nr:MAG: hypothetical protein DME77_06805 [Verrucomicrobiota bacterium]PYL12783.1 MAG: hypothetical protein DMF43_07420 [Verrucomicrobiota bacterium]
MTGEKRRTLHARGARCNLPQIPNPKLQHPNKLRTPIFNFQNKQHAAVWILGIEVCLELGFWDLDLRPGLTAFLL